MGRKRSSAPPHLTRPTRVVLLSAQRFHSGSSPSPRFLAPALYRRVCLLCHLVEKKGSCDPCGLARSASRLATWSTWKTSLALYCASVDSLERRGVTAFLVCKLVSSLARAQLRGIPVVVGCWYWTRRLCPWHGRTARREKMGACVFEPRHAEIALSSSALSADTQSGQLDSYHPYA